MNDHAHTHHHDDGHSCVVPQPGPDRATELGRLRFLATKVAMVHGPAYPQMAVLAGIVERVAATPERAIAADDRASLSRLTTGYSPWLGACGSVRALFAGLQQLPDDPA